MSDTDTWIRLIVEGPTERDFVDALLKPEFAYKGIYVTASTLGKTGGNVNFERLKKDVMHCLKEQSNCYVSTMFDFFRIDSEWPGMDKIVKLKASKTKLIPEAKAKILEDATAEKIAQARFIPHIQMHEFETLLYSEPEAWREFSISAVDFIQGIANQYPDPEEINDGGETSPSKRVTSKFKGYSKRIHGINIAKQIGLPTMRKKCSHFNQWLTQLESLKPLS
jgi:hypothetical protein